jgi:two-component SAPR family response regulator
VKDEGQFYFGTEINLRILLADDEATVTSFLVRLLKTSGLSDVAATNTPEETIDYIEKNKPDLVFLDINFKAQMNGLDILQRVHLSAPESKICMLSAYREEHEQLCLGLKAVAFLKKPTTVEDLLGVVAKFNK